MVLTRLGKHFDFFEEVWAADRATGHRYRLDAMSVCEGTGYVLGWEFKKSHLFKAEFATALHQAACYRDAHIDDPRLHGFSYKIVSACIVCPDWDGLHDSGRLDYVGEAHGMRLLASHFRAGVLHENIDKNALSIVIGEQAIWHCGTGWTKNAAGVLLGKKRKGSSKKLDLDLA